MTEHTPTPWAPDPIEKDLIVHRGGMVARCERRGPKEHGRMQQETLANVAFIVKAVNSHEKLIAALESIADWRQVNIQGEYEHGLRDIIRSITDCAAAALDATSVTSAQRGEV